ncbi:PREDICTED: uncharacterized protein LOC106320950 isoform X3 [Brassica oleracea var. oleracea]|uniref:uncharacterized protein LOC106320950 isoform X3 n=1 Tax=Brassica oleracea var. oleracea TaxID=109376 RepID=UPI0006A6AE3F|nr:PREDICTED: uncharacterized protein LOC106320950 isoform X3 [Brassica oleracea var. oleracea]
MTTISLTGPSNTAGHMKHLRSVLSAYPTALIYYMTALCSSSVIQLSTSDNRSSKPPFDDKLSWVVSFKSPWIQYGNVGFQNLWVSSTYLCSSIFVKLPHQVIASYSGTSSYAAAIPLRSCPNPLSSAATQPLTLLPSVINHSPLPWLSSRRLDSDKSSNCGFAFSKWIWDLCQVRYGPNLMAKRHTLQN